MTNDKWKIERSSLTFPSLLLEHIQDPLRRIGFLIEFHLQSQTHRPPVQPRRSVQPDVIVPRLISLVLQRLIKTDEAIAAGFQSLQHLVQAIGVDVVRVNQKDLADLSPEHLA